MRRVRKQRNSGDVVLGKPANFNRRKPRAISGDHKIQCDITGQVCLRSEARLTWDGLLVSNQNWDVRHPQLDIHVPPEDISVANARPFKSEFSNPFGLFAFKGLQGAFGGFASLTDSDSGGVLAGME